MTVRAYRHLETTAPLVHACRRCHTPVIYGLAEGVTARADLLPITSAGEIAAVLAGRQTYTVRRSGLIRRDAGRRADPTLASPVLAEHRCSRRGSTDAA